MDAESPAGESQETKGGEERMILWHKETELKQAKKHTREIRNAQFKESWL